MKKTASAPLNLTTEQISELQNTSRILYLLHHRNYNQHRRQHWYPSFSAFRRHLTHLIHDITITHKPKALPSTLLPTRRKEIVRICEKRVEKRLELWQTIVIRKWFGGFSQLVGDNQFAVLGLVLLGCLGRVCEVTGVKEQMLEEGDVAGIALEGFAQGQEVEEVFRESQSDIGVPISKDGLDDLGEAVKRKDDDTLVLSEVKPRRRKMPDSPADEACPKEVNKSKKKAKKRDAIDDLFSGLV